MKKIIGGGEVPPSPFRECVGSGPVRGSARWGYTRSAYFSDGDPVFSEVSRIRKTGVPFIPCAHTRSGMRSAHHIVLNTPVLLRGEFQWKSWKCGCILGKYGCMNGKKGESEPCAGPDGRYSFRPFGLLGVWEGSLMLLLQMPHEFLFFKHCGDKKNYRRTREKSGEPFLKLKKKIGKHPMNFSKKNQKKPEIKKIQPNRIKKNFRCPGPCRPDLLFLCTDKNIVC